MGKFKDLTGQLFGRLTVIERVDDYVSPKGQHKVQYLCQCNCGNEIIVSSGDLRSGNTRSCGCLSIEKIVERSKKYNQYDLSGEYGVGYTSDGSEFWFDIEDYEKIKNYCWSYNNQGYVVARDSELKQPIKLHRLVMNVNDPQIKVDHKMHLPKNEHKIDNRKSNLILVNSSKNNMNRAMASNNTSGCTGVYWNQERNKWVVQIQRKYVGTFDNFEDAVNARMDAEIKYFGEHRYSANNA